MKVYGAIFLNVGFVGLVGSTPSTNNAIKNTTIKTVDSFLVFVIQSPIKLKYIFT